MSRWFLTYTPHQQHGVCGVLVDSWLFKPSVKSIKQSMLLYVGLRDLLSPKELETLRTSGEVSQTEFGIDTYTYYLWKRK